MSSPTAAAARLSDICHKLSVRRRQCVVVRLVQQQQSIRSSSSNQALHSRLVARRQCTFATTIRTSSTVAAGVTGTTFSIFGTRTFVNHNHHTHHQNRFSLGYSSSASASASVSSKEQDDITDDTATDIDDDDEEEEDVYLKRILPENDSIWMQRYEMLNEYRAQHGDCRIPHIYDKNPTLGHWVSTQRRQRNRMLTGKKIFHITPERIRMLDKIDFDWEPHYHTWMHRFGELKEYQEKHGDGLVPYGYPDNPALGQWVCKQRRQYKLFQVEQQQQGNNNNTTNETKSQMTQERIDLLKEIDFSWNTLEDLWTKKYQELQDYHLQHGNTLVPLRYKINPPLARWVRFQREAFRKRQEDESNMDDDSSDTTSIRSDSDSDDIVSSNYNGPMTDERVHLLQELEFCWHTKDAAWMTKFDELKEFVRIHGMISSSMTSKNQNAPLFDWIRYQRRQYRKDRLDPKRYKLLESIGILF
eukprot:CAMPEP_0198140770 /NCGR_PEP_ID=MMETSP1443-20131203/3880_1 /TAXON_ID=186043 /ORGANISM="Entomoneis sp., Strain CCMP2396" /LENGTH=472 /DNA_ID=CAMNT_0043803299 /DNA_START=77 /DNA_END=1495 /DNA_ORIENTATION=+